MQWDTGNPPYSIPSYSFVDRTAEGATSWSVGEWSAAAAPDGVEADFGMTAPGVAQQKTDVLFRDLRLRPGSRRDRSRVIVQRARRLRAVGPGHLPPRPGHGQRAHASRGARGTHFVTCVGLIDASDLPCRDVFAPAHQRDCRTGRGCDRC